MSKQQAEPTLEMELEIKKRCAALLGAAVAQAITEDSFWDQFEKLEHPEPDPFADIAYETAIH